MPDDIVKQLRDSACPNDCRCHYCNRNKAAADEIERLRKERNEARQEICNSKKRGLTTHLDYARKRGWDCFKETP